MSRVLVSSPTVRRDPAKISPDDHRSPELHLEIVAHVVEPSPPPRDLSATGAFRVSAESRLAHDVAAGREGRDLVDRQHAKASHTRRTSVRQLRRQRQIAAQDLQVDAENLAKIAGPSRLWPISLRSLYVDGPRIGALQVTPGAIPQGAIGRSLFGRSSTQNFGARASLDAASGRRGRARVPVHAEALHEALDPASGSYIVT